MPDFHYSALDSTGTAITGNIAAADAAAARALLAGRSLHVQTLTPATTAHSAAPTPGESAPGARLPTAPLSATDALQLAGQLADMTSAQLPLSTGLRALCRDLPRGRLATATQRLADHIEQGVPLATAVALPDVRLPATVRGLIACGTGAGQLPLVLEQFLEHERLASETRRRLWSALAYPALLFVLLAGWCVFVLADLVPDFARIYRNLDIAQPATTQLLFQCSQELWQIVFPAVLGIAAALCCLLLGIRTAWVANLLAEVPWFGPLWRDGRLAEAYSLLSLLLENHLPLPTALELTATGCRDSGVAAGCRAAAALAASGQPLSGCLAQARPFPPSLVPVVAWGDRQSAQPEALATAAELLRTRADQRAQLLTLVLPPMMLLGMAAIVIFVVAGLFAPMLRMVQSLAWSPQFATADPTIGIPAGAVSLFLLGMALLASLRILDLEEPTASNDPISLAIGTAGWLLIILGWLVLLVFLANFVGLLLWLGSLVIGVSARSQWHRLRLRSHLALLGAAAAKQIPLADCVRAFADEQHGPFRRQVLKFAEALEQGTPLAAAIRQAPRALPWSSRLAARVGEQSGRVAAALQEEAATLSSFDPLRRTFGARLLYLAGVLLLVQLPVTYTFFKVLPSLENIFRDFDIQMPALSRWVLEAAKQPAVLVLAAVSPLLWAAILAWGTAVYTGWATWIPPGLRRLLVRFDSSAILRALAYPAERRQPLEPMIEQLAASYPRRWVRQRLLRAHGLIAAGQNWIASLQAQTLVGPADAAVFEAAQRAGNLAWALREMADSNQRRLIYRLQALLQVGSVLVVLLLGFCVMLIAFAAFVPLVTMISELAHAQ